MRVRIADRPGTLAQLLSDIQAVNANVVDIEHNRLDPALSVDEVSVVVHVETHGAEHSAAVLAAMRAAGYAVQAD